MFKIAYCAGHYLGTAGKRVPKEFDSKQTQEWVLNDRIADYFAQAASEYEGVELLRTDDPAGKKDIAIKNRTAKANDWGANFYLDIHHNAGAKLTSAGGVVAFSKPGSAMGCTYRDAIYNAVIAVGGLKGNRSNPKAEKGYTTLMKSKATAVLIEYGFMDSKTDYPVIATDKYAKAVAYATMSAIADVAGLKKKTEVKPVEPNKAEGCTVNVRVLKKGVNGDDVKALQVLLIGYGYKMTNNGKTYGPDGSFGAATEKALKQYQKDKGLVADGLCGSKTWNKILGVE